MKNTVKTWLRIGGRMGTSIVCLVLSHPLNTVSCAVDAAQNYLNEVGHFLHVFQDTHET